MTTYNTGNPIGSTDARDLYDNAQALDTAINSAEPTFTDRLGKVRPTLASTTDPTGLAQTAVNAKVAAEAARDAALIQSGVYADEPTGRAAVADGAAFKVQGSGDVAAYEYRRVNASSSTLIATYPSKAAYDAILGPRKNLFNTATVTADKYVSNLDGLLYDNTAYYTSDFIPVVAGSAYAVSGQTAQGVRFTSYYNASRQFVAGGANTNINSFTPPTNAAYIRITIYKPALNTFQVELGSQSTSYEAYQVVLKAALGIRSIGTDSLKSEAVTRDQIAVGAVTPRRTTFFQLGKNLFDKLAVTEGYYLGNDGFLVQSASYVVSDFIPVSAGSTYALSRQAGDGVRFTCYYDANKVFVAGGKSSAIDGAITSLTAPTGVAFVRVTIYVASVSTFQFELGAAATAYAPFGNINTEYIKQIETSKIADGAVTLAKTAFVVSTKNLFNKAAVVADKYVSNLDGLLYDNTAYYTSDFIPVVAGSAYSLSYTVTPSTGVRFTCYYDSNKQFVAGGANTNISGFTAPVGAAFVRITIYKNTLDTFQMELGSQPTSYVPYGYTIDPAVLPGVIGAPEMVMPPTIYAVQGRECNVYLDNLHFGDANNWWHNVDGAIAGSQQQNERWTWTPAAAMTSGVLAITAHDKRTGSLVASVSAQQRAAASSAGSGTNKKVLVIGDSLIGAGTITQTLLDIAGGDVMGVTLLGTLGTAPNKHEGRGGWAISTYASGTEGNPFWISGSFNFPQYLTNNSLATPDWVMIHLGINDCFGQTSDPACAALADTEFAKLDTMIASIKAADANTKVGLMIPVPPSADQDAFGSSYGTGQTRWRHKRNILIWARQLIAKYAGQEASRIYLVPTNTALDTVNNMQRAASAPVNSRSAVTATRQSNGVHPAASGYQQMGDALWAFLKYHA